MRPYLSTEEILYLVCEGTLPVHCFHFTSTLIPLYLFSEDSTWAGMHVYVHEQYVVLACKLCVELLMVEAMGGRMCGRMCE